MREHGGEVLSAGNDPYYYNYAKENIRCDCPLCFCPFRDKKRYSFVYICEKRKIIYYDVPKCASSTIRETFFGNDHQLSLRSPNKELSEYFKFSFVRNPWDRMVSNWKTFTTRPFRIQQLKSMTNKDVSTFEEFVHFAVHIKNHHWQPQVLYLPDHLDFLGKVENFDEDFSRLCLAIGERPAHVRMLNTTERTEYWHYYTPQLVELVSEMYSEDIKLFGYKFDKHPTA